MKHGGATARAAILRALAHPARVLLVDALRRGDRCVGELNGLLDLDQSNVSRHLATLQRAGIVSGRREGPKVVYHLETPCILKAFDCAVEVVRARARRRGREGA